MSGAMDGVDADAAELDGEEGDDQAEAAPDKPRWTFDLQDVADVLERVLGEKQLTDRELLRGFLDAVNDLPNRDKLRHSLSPAIAGMVRQRMIAKKHGLWFWIPFEERRSPTGHHDKKKPSAPAALAARLIWPPLTEPCGKLLDAGEGQARMWMRCARPGCHVRTEVIFYLPGLDDAARAGLADTEVARRWACPACADFLRRQDLTRAQREAESQALRVTQRPMPSPSVICTLLRRGTAEGDALARDQLRIHRESVDDGTFARMMELVFLELDQMVPTKRHPGATAQHRARIGAFRLFAGWPAPAPSPAPARRRRSIPAPPAQLPERRPF